MRADPPGRPLVFVGLSSNSINGGGSGGLTTFASRSFLSIFLTIPLTCRSLLWHSIAAIW